MKHLSPPPRNGFRRFFFLIQNPIPGTPHPYVYSYHYATPYHEALYATHVQSNDKLLTKRQIEQWAIHVPCGARISVVFADLPEHWLNPEVFKPEMK